MRTSPLLVPCAVLVFAASAAAETLKVPQDFENISAAAAVANPGDTIQVSKGTYQELVVIDDADVKLVGKKAILDARYQDDAITVNASGVTITGMTIVNGANGILGGHPGLTVSKCIIATCSINGISVQNADATITGNTITACGADGIEFNMTPSGATLIEKNTCVRNGGNGIEVRGSGVVVRKNRCEDNEGDGIDAGMPIPVADGDGPPMTFEDNVCEGNEDNGLILVSSTEAPVLIHGNDFLDNADTGFLFDGKNADIQGNRCDGNVDDGMFLATENSVVTGNSASGNQGSGIVLTESGQVLEGAPFGGDHNTISKNTCNDNTNDGIRVLLGASNTFLGNKCSGNGDDGLDFESINSTDCTVESNNLSNNGHEGLDNGAVGTDVIKNTCKGNGRGSAPDIAGKGDVGAGSVDTFQGNKFDTGGELAPAELDNYENTSP